MFGRILTCFVVVSAMLAMTSSRATAQTPKLPAGSKVFIASMDGFDKYFRAATKGVEFPLVFVKTRAEAVYEVTGSTKEVRPGGEAVNGIRTSHLDTTVRVLSIDSGQTVFTHSIRTTVNWPNDSENVWPAKRNSTPSNILAIGKEAAARQCGQALRNAINTKSTN
jgi:hypothetical protein